MPVCSERFGVCAEYGAMYCNRFLLTLVTRYTPYGSSQHRTQQVEIFTVTVFQKALSLGLIS